MNGRDLDRWITGNYGEDQFKGRADERDIDKAWGEGYEAAGEYTRNMNPYIAGGEGDIDGRRDAWFDGFDDAAAEKRYQETQRIAENFYDDLTS
jgi:hypothetical protein